MSPEPCCGYDRILQRAHKLPKWHHLGQEEKTKMLLTVVCFGLKKDEVTWPIWKLSKRESRIRMSSVTFALDELIIDDTLILV